MSVFKALSADVGADTVAGRTFAVTGTVVQELLKLRGDLAATHAIDDVVWTVARAAWSLELEPNQHEIDAFCASFSQSLEVVGDQHSLWSRVRLRARNQPLVLLRLLAGNIKLGPWLMTLVAAVHAGAGAAVQDWAEGRLITMGAQGAHDFNLSPDQGFVLLRQAKAAAEAFHNDLRSVACNPFWKRIPHQRMYLEMGATLPTIKDRQALDDRWRSLLTHMAEYDAPVYRIGAPTRGIEWRGLPTRARDDYFVETTLSAFLQELKDRFLKHPLSNDEEDILLRSAKALPGPAQDASYIQNILGLAIETLPRHVSMDSRVVQFTLEDNLRPLLLLGTAIAGRGDKLNRHIQMMCEALSGVTVRSTTSDTIVAIQTPVGLFVPFPIDGWTNILWRLQDIRIAGVADGTVFVYSDPGDGDNVLNQTAGIGNWTNRPVHDSISGVIVPNRFLQLEALCVVRGELVIVDYSRILARLQKAVLVPSCGHGTRTGDTEYAYITADLVFKAIREQLLCLGDHEHVPLYLLGDNFEWQLLALSTAPGIVTIQRDACEECARRVALQHHALCIIAGGPSSMGQISLERSWASQSLFSMESKKARLEQNAPFGRRKRRARTGRRISSQQCFGHHP